MPLSTSSNEVAKILRVYLTGSMQSCKATVFPVGLWKRRRKFSRAERLVHQKELETGKGVREEPLLEHEAEKCAKSMASALLHTARRLRLTEPSPATGCTKLGEVSMQKLHGYPVVRCLDHG
jgi:hypothetical protein